MPSTRRRKLASKKMDKVARTLQPVSDTVTRSMEETKPADDQTTSEIMLAKASIGEACKTPIETSGQEGVIAPAAATLSTSFKSRGSPLQLPLVKAPPMPQQQQQYQQVEARISHLTSPSTPIEVQVLTRTSIANLVANACESANLAMKVIERYPITHDDKANIMSQNEIRRIDIISAFLDGLLDGRTFISLPADCTLDGTRRLLEQIQLAEGVRAIAIRLEEFEDDFTKSKMLTTAPRLFLVLSDKSASRISDREDGLFQAMLSRLMTTCTLPTSEFVKETIITPFDASRATEPAPETASKEQESGNTEETTFPSLFNTPSTLNTPSAGTIQLQPTPKVEFHPEILPRRAYSVPEAFSLPWVHQSISGWRSTSMPTWTICTRPHIHNDHHEHQPNTPSMSSSASSVVTGAEEPQSPVVMEDGSHPTSVCMHSRELSNSESVITAATSVHSDEDGEDQMLKKQEMGRLKNTDEEASMLGGIRRLPLREDSDTSLANSLYSQETLLPSFTTVSKPNEHAVQYGAPSTYPFTNKSGHDQPRSTVKTNLSMMVDHRGFHKGSRFSLKWTHAYRFPPCGVSFYRMDPPPCNRHYLLEEGCALPSCPYAHDYLFSDYEIDRLRQDSKKSPCTSLRSGVNCRVGPENCHMGHVCPYGNQCRYGRNCKFLNIPFAHDGPPVNEYHASQAARQQGELTTSLLKSALPALPPRVPTRKSIFDSLQALAYSQRQLARSAIANAPALSIQIPACLPARPAPMTVLSPPHLVFPMQAKPVMQPEVVPVALPLGTAQRTAVLVQTKPVSSPPSAGFQKATVIPSERSQWPEDRFLSKRGKITRSGIDDTALASGSTAAAKGAKPGEDTPRRTFGERRPYTPSFRGQKRKFPLRHDTRTPRVGTEATQK